MNKLEEQLWSYIDGSCNAAEKAEIEARLAIDEHFRLLHEELLVVNELLAEQLEIDEPSMSFTRNVMEQVQQEIAPIKLKTKVDNRVIYAIGGFFSFTLLAILGYAIITATPEFTFKTPSLNLDGKFDQLFNASVLKVVLLLNAVLLLIYLDGYLRKGLTKTQKKESN